MCAASDVCSSSPIRTDQPDWKRHCEFLTWSSALAPLLLSPSCPPTHLLIGVSTPGNSGIFKVQSISHCMHQQVSVISVYLFSSPDCCCLIKILALQYVDCLCLQYELKADNPLILPAPGLTQFTPDQVHVTLAGGCNHSYLSFIRIPCGKSDRELTIAAMALARAVSSS